MSDSMHAIAWLELDEFDLGVSSFNRMFEHIAGDFLVTAIRIRSDIENNLCYFKRKLILI